MNKQTLMPIGTDRSSVRRETNPFAILQNEIDRLFDGFSRTFPSSMSTVTVPSMDVSETDKIIEIVAEIPGLEKDDIKLNVSDNLLTIRGDKKNEREEKNRDYHLVERSFGSFSRSIELPAGVAAESITAEMAKGVLKIVVQKPVQKEAKQIDIKTAA